MAEDEQEPSVEPVSTRDTEARERLGGPVHLYRYVSKDSLDQITSQGINVQGVSDDRNTPIEQIFADEAVKQGIKIDRRQAIFAFPRHPSSLKQQAFRQPDSVLIELQVDPDTPAIVADAEAFTSASVSLNDHDEQGARSWAETYWQDSKPLTTYLAEKHHGAVDDFDDFQLPEVMITQAIPASKIRVV